jgi:hypothetical protein
MRFHSEVLFNWRVIVLLAMVAMVLWLSVAACKQFKSLTLPARIQE